MFLFAEFNSSGKTIEWHLYHNHNNNNMNFVPLLSTVDVKNYDLPWHEVAVWKKNYACLDDLWPYLIQLSMVAQINRHTSSQQLVIN